MNSLCDRALLHGYVGESKVITGVMINEVSKELPALAESPFLDEEDDHRQRQRVHVGEAIDG